MSDKNKVLAGMDLLQHTAFLTVAHCPKFDCELFSEGSTVCLHRTYCNGNPVLTGTLATTAIQKGVRCGLFRSFLHGHSCTAPAANCFIYCVLDNNMRTPYFKKQN